MSFNIKEISGETVEDEELRKEYFESLTEFVLSSEPLRDAYPTLEKWWDKELENKIKTGQDKCLTAIDGDEVKGVLIHGPEKGTGYEKLKTFYLDESIRGSGLGPRMI